MEDLGATENSVVFKVGSSDSWGVVGDDQQLAAALSQRLLCLFETWTIGEQLRTEINLPTLYFPDLTHRPSFWFMFSTCVAFFTMVMLLSKTD